MAWPSPAALSRTTVRCCGNPERRCMGFTTARKIQSHYIRHGSSNFPIVSVVPCQLRPRRGLTISRAVGIEGPPLVEELMNPNVISLPPDMLIRDAVKLFLEHRISGAPVVDSEKRVLGILSETDIMWKEVGVPDDHWLIQPTFIGFADLVVAFRDDKKFKSELQKVLAQTVGEAMTANPVVVSPSVSAQEAASTMLHKKVTQLPVVEEGKLVGFLTRSDILRGMLLNGEL